MENRKNNGYVSFAFGLFLGVFISIIGLVFIGVIAITNVTGFNALRYLVKSKNTSNIEIVKNDLDFDFSKIAKKLKIMNELIEKNYLFEVDKEKLEDGIYKGFMKALDDPYSEYFNEEEQKALTEDTEGVYFGIGAMVSQDPNTKRMKIIKIFEDSPSQKAGLMVDDIIYKVDDMDISDMDSSIVIGKYIRGLENTDVKITVLRGVNEEEVELIITRGKVEVPTVESRMIDDKIGYLSINQFDLITFSQFKKNIEKLEEEGMKKLIIDLRNNPGGVLSTTVDILDFILPNGLLVYTANKDGYGSKFFSDNNKEIGIELVVLINENSASASELFAGAIKDFGYGKIVGKKSFGKGIVQNFVPLFDNTALKITTEHYYTKSGNEIHKKGIEPDILVELDENAVIGTESDNQLNEAIRILK